MTKHDRHDRTLVDCVRESPLEELTINDLSCHSSWTVVRFYIYTWLDLRDGQKFKTQDASEPAKQANQVERKTTYTKQGQV